MRGILAAFDAQEDGSRELSGEWVVSKKLWQKLQAEWKHGQHNSKDQDEKMDKAEPRKQYEERVILFLHGGRLCLSALDEDHTLTILSVGAYYLASPATHRGITVPLSKATGCRVFGTESFMFILEHHSIDLQVLFIQLSITVLHQKHDSLGRYTTQRHRTYDSSTTYIYHRRIF